MEVVIIIIPVCLRPVVRVNWHTHYDNWSGNRTLNYSCRALEQRVRIGLNEESVCGKITT